MDSDKKESKSVYFTPESLAQRLVVIVDNCSLEIGQTKRGYELLSCEEHYWLIKKRKKTPEDYRPDLVHQTLMALLDSPLNKNHKLQIFLRTIKGHTIEVSPEIRIPRTYKRFSGLFAQLMTKGRINASSTGGKTLLEVNNYPIHTLVHSSCRYYKLNHETRGNLVMNLPQYVE